MRERGVGWAIVFAIALLFAKSAADVASSWNTLKPLEAGRVAPPFELPRIAADGTLSADLVSLESLRGHVVVLDFWATWCAPCRASMPLLEEVAARYPELRVLSINVEGEERAAAAKEMADELAASLTLISDSGEVAGRYGVTTIPHLVVIDRDGTVRWAQRGFPGRDAGEAALEKVLRGLFPKDSALWHPLRNGPVLVGPGRGPVVPGSGPVSGPGAARGTAAAGNRVH